MNLFKTSAEKEFNVDIISSDLMEIAQTEWQNIIKGVPYWLKKNVRTNQLCKVSLLLHQQKDLSGSQCDDQRQ